MLENMSPQQWDEWQAVDLLDPIGTENQMLPFLAFMVSTYLSDGSSEKTIEDWLPLFQHVKQPAENAKAKQMLNTIFGG